MQQKIFFVPIHELWQMISVQVSKKSLYLLTCSVISVVEVWFNVISIYNNILYCTRCRRSVISFVCVCGVFTASCSLCRCVLMCQVGFAEYC